MKSNSSSDILKDNSSSGTSFSRDVFRHLKDIIRKTPHTTTEEDTDTDEESYGFKQLEQKLKERREKEKRDEEQKKKEEGSRLQELEREQCKKLPEPRLSAQLPARTRNSIAACTHARRSHDGVMTSHLRNNNFVRTPNLNRRQREHIVQRLEKFKKNPPNQEPVVNNQRRKESTASLQNNVAKYQVRYLKDVKYCNDPRNRRFNVEQAANKAQSTSYSPNILPFVLAKVTQNNNNNHNVYYDDTNASKPNDKNPQPETNLNRNLAFMTSQEMYEEKRDARRKLRSHQKAQRGRPLEGNREKGIKERCASEENVFSKAQQFRHQKVHRQKSCEDPQEASHPSAVRRRHTLRDDDDVVTNRNLKSRRSSGQKPPDYDRAVSNQRRHKMESYL